jgi:hypothetical protein
MVEATGEFSGTGPPIGPPEHHCFDIDEVERKWRITEHQRVIDITEHSRTIVIEEIPCN